MTYNASLAYSSWSKYEYINIQGWQSHNMNILEHEANLIRS